LSDHREPDPKAEAATPEPTLTELLIPEAPQETPDMEQSRSACKKHYRDTIDAIDAEIGREYSPDKTEQYKQQLLLLTRKLRQC